MTLSQGTYAELIQAAADAYTHDQLHLLFLRLGISGDAQIAYAPDRSKLKRLRRAVDLLDQDDRVIELARELLEEHLDGRVEDRGSFTRQLTRLVEALRTDGYELVGGRLVASTPGPAALAPEISRLERDLEDRSLHTALNHYRQAVEAFVGGSLEASNGQLRSALEAAIMELCTSAAGETSRSARSAVDRLLNHGLIDGDEAKLLQGLLGMSNQNGAHAGLTGREEALFRLHLTTATLRYLLSRIDIS